MDDVLVRAAQLSNRVERAKLYQRAQIILVDDLPWLPLYVRLVWGVARPEIQNLRLHPTDLAYIASHGGDRAVVVDKMLVPLLEQFVGETQIERMKPGQPVSVHVDAIDRDYDGTVESFAGATGSRYSLLPPENATGNYVKVVQRIPVRIRLQARQGQLDRLRPGMSVVPRVYVR